MAISDAVAGWFKGVFDPNGVLNMSWDADKWAADLGKDIWDGLKGGLQAGWDAFMTFWNMPLTEIISKAKEILGISSPSSVFATIGKNIVQGLWDGMESMWDNFSTWILSKLQAIVDVLNPETLWLIATTDLTLAQALANASSTTLGTGGRDMSGTTTGTTGTTTGTGSGTVINQYFAGATINVGSWDEIAYDCIYPNPFIAATSNQLGSPSSWRDQS